MRTLPILHPLGLAAILFISSCGGDDPTPSGGVSGQITGSSVGGVISISDIEVYDADAKTLTTLNKGLNPHRHSDGKIYFANFVDFFADDTLRIYSTTGGGTAPQLVYTTGISQGLFGLRTSPDGRHISFSVEDSTESAKHPVSGTIVLDASTKQVIKSIRGLYDAQWTPDNRLVGAGTRMLDYFSNPRTARAGIYITDATFSTLTRIDPNLNLPREPAISSDGNTIACKVDKHIFTFPVSGASSAKQITTGGKDESNPTWSPDGSKIACICYGTWESTFYNALAIVPANPASPTEMVTDINSGLYPIDQNAVSSSTNGRINWEDDQMTWR